MPGEKILLVCCLLLYSASTAAGFVLAGFRAGEIAVLLSVVLWVTLRKKHPSACLLLSTAIVAAAAFTGVPRLLLLISAGASLVLWDLSLTDLAFSGSLSPAAAVRFRAVRTRALALSLGITSVLGLLGWVLAVKIPFYLMLFLLILTAFFFERVVALLEQDRR